MPPDRPRWLAVLGWGLLVVGALIVATGLGNAIGWAAFARRAETVPAVIERFERVPGSGDRRIYRFRAPDGREVSARSLVTLGGPFSDYREPLAVGAALDVHFDPADPTRAVAGSLATLTLKPLLLLPMGLVPILGGWVVLRARRRPPPEGPDRPPCPPRAAAPRP